MRTAAVIALACIVTVAWMWNPGHSPRFDVSDIGYYSFRDELNGDADKGICYRVLVPYLCRFAQWALPAEPAYHLAVLADMAPLREMDLEADLMPAYAMMGLVALASFTALGLLAGPWALVLAWMAISPKAGPADPATLATFALGMWALSRGKTWQFWAAFALASLNRETAPLLLLWWVIAGRGIKPAAIGLAAWIALRGVLAYVYADNPNVMCWPMLEHNLKAIAPLSLTTGTALLSSCVLASVGAMRSPEWQQRALLSGLALLAGMAIMWSRPEHARVYLEIVPLAGIFLGRGVAHVIGIHKE